MSSQIAILLELYIRHGLLGHRGSCHAPVTQAADTMPDGVIERHTEIELLHR